MDSAAEDFFSDSAQFTDSDSNQQGVYFVPYRWWKEAHDSISAGSNEKKGVMYEGSPASSYGGPMKLINNIFNSDIAFNLRREEDAAVLDGENGEVGVSGRDFALVSGEMWVQALKWHSEAKISLKESRSFSAAEDDMSDVYPLQLRLGVVRETNTLAVRITKKDNSTELFKRACKIFSSDTEMLRIWDFSGQTTLFFLGDNNRPLNCPRQPDQEVLLELQIYGLSDSTKCREGKKDEKGLQNYNGSFLMNGSTCNGKSQSIFIFKSCGEAGSLGLAGLHNLGNTCFMNSSLQCLAHTPRLVDYFLGDYTQEINHGNPLGMDGEIALAFGDLLRKLWEPGATAVAPRPFKTKLARFAPQFSGYNQHDSQELLAFLLDGLHEDLNRVKCKPYVEAKDTEERPDAEVADEYWHYHLARNNSIIVDVCQGQYKSTLVCPVCKKVSFTFDPFMYLSLPLPSTTTRTMTLTVVCSITNGSAKPSPYTITVPKNGKFEDLIQALSAACALGSDETLLVAEVYNSRIIRFLEDPSDSLKLIRDEDQLVAYRLTKPCDQGPLVVFMHRKPEQYLPGSLASYNKTSEIPLVARLSSSSANGSDICSLYHGLLSPFRKPIEDALVEDSSTVKNLVEDTNREDEPCPLLDADVNYPDMKIDNPQIESCTRTAFAEVANGEVDSCPLVDSDVNSSLTKTVGSQLESELQFYLTDEKGFLRDTLIKMDEPILSAGTSTRLNVLVCWSEEQIKKYDDCLFSLSPEMVRSGFLAKKPQETVSLYKCLEAFLTEEPLGPEDMWYCPRCKEHRQASKKLDLWRLPEILVIHLKRFSYDRFLKNKLETYVDFPVDDLDLSSYIASGNSQPSDRYMLYAISNHYGSMGGGHYTAFVHHGGGRWYDFDDNRVSPISPDKIKTSAAYVLFYRRVSED